MATQKRNKSVKPQVDTGTIITTPSAYGSHSVMRALTPEGIEIGTSQCVCQDDKGLYVTDVNRLDNGLADPNRYNPKMRILLPSEDCPWSRFAPQL
jgi:hypothetical protein